MKILDNITDIVRDDLKQTIKRGSKVSVAAACFSMYAYKELKNHLEQVKEFRFIFTSPTFIAEMLRSRNGDSTFQGSTGKAAYMPLNGFTTVDIGCERGNNSYNMVNRMESPFSTEYLQLFETLWNDREKMQDVTDIIISNISTAYSENSPEFIYFLTLYHVFSDISEDILPNEATGFKQSKIGSSITAVYWLTALAWSKPLPLLLSSNITKTGTSPFLFSVPKSWQKTGIPISITTSTIPSLLTG